MRLLGILNITPDSFSNNGGAPSPEEAAAKAKLMIKDGASAIDIGAESTRPGATPITAKEEWERLYPVLEKLHGVTLSIDTRNPRTAEQAMQYHNVNYLNDVSGFTDPEMVRIAKKNNVSIIVMHSLSVPADKNIVLTSPPVEALQEWIAERFSKLTIAGIHPEKIIFDPGIGFGKSPEQSFNLIENADKLAGICHMLGCKILYGHSRKSFLGGDIASRDAETANITAQLKVKSVDYVRVHDVKINHTAVKGKIYN